MKPTGKFRWLELDSQPTRTLQQFYTYDGNPNRDVGEWRTIPVVTLAEAYPAVVPVEVAAKPVPAAKPPLVPPQEDKATAENPT
jgi:hypothetical protein